MSRLLINILAFQAVWFSSVLGAANGYPLLGPVVGALGGPLSYVAGERLGALELLSRGAALTALAVGWAVLTPCLVRLSQRLDGVRAPAEAVHQHA